jgi:hypothetical protein
MNIHTIVLPTRPQIDTTCAVFILRTYRENSFPGVKEAKVIIQGQVDATKSFYEHLDEGVLILDSGFYIYDHHGKDNVCLTDLVIQNLGLSENRELAKLREFCHRDDLFGKGIVSKDPLDKAFGLPGLLVNINKKYPNDPNKVFEIMHEIYDAHVKEELRREYEIPEEISRRTEDGSLTTFECSQKDVKLKCCIISSDNLSIPGYLRSVGGGAYDIVAQIRSTGHIAIMTKQNKAISLKGLALVVRLEELAAQSLNLNLSIEKLTSAGALDEIPNWYFDPGTNSLLNGSSSATNIEATKIDTSKIKEILSLGLSEKMFNS